MCVFLFYLFSCSVYLQGLYVWGSAFVCTRGALIPDSPSNYLNCAYRSYCTVHFPLESYTLSSFMSAALAIEISTLGNFALHNKFYTWGMFLSKNVWAERKTAFLPNGILSFLYFHLPTPSLSSSSCLSLIACTRRDEFLDRKALAADCSVILQLLVDRTVQPSRKSVLSAFTPINRSDCYMSHKTTALKWNTMELLEANFCL